jgi:DNA methylase/ParB-like nuclease domain
MPAKSKKPRASWPADRVERRPVSVLIPDARNARTHSSAQIDQIAASIKEWGWTVPVLVDESGGIIAGHGRVLAARKLKIADVPVMVASGWTEAQKRAYALADNQLALNAGWDDELLKGEIDQLTLWSIAPAGTEDAATIHGTQKPVEAMRRPIVNNSERGDLIYEPFCGSGTTLIAAETVGRSCLAMELDPAYCDVIVKRWQAFTGKGAVLEPDGRTFDDLAVERKA